VRAIWLDGRNAMTIDSAGRPVHLEEGASDMTLRTAVIRADGTISSEALIDPRVCDCCQTSAVATSGGAVVAYRDRSAAETRDISVSVFANGAWSEPANVHADGWKINGCPVNGPALASMSQRFGSIVLRTVAAAWFSAARDTARVLFASSNDGGRSFGLCDSARWGRAVGACLDALRWFRRGMGDVARDARQGSADSTAARGEGRCPRSADHRGAHAGRTVGRIPADGTERGPVRIRVDRGGDAGSPANGDGADFGRREALNPHRSGASQPKSRGEN
jgi:hypothetical protein